MRGLVKQRECTCMDTSIPGYLDLGSMYTSLMGLGLAFYVLGFLENTAKIVKALHVIGFAVLSSISLCVGL